MGVSWTAPAMNFILEEHALVYYPVDASDAMLKAVLVTSSTTFQSMLS